MVKKSIVVIVTLVLLSFSAYVASQNICGISFNGITRCGKYPGDVPDIGAYEHPGPEGPSIPTRFKRMLADIEEWLKHV